MSEDAPPKSSVEVAPEVLQRHADAWQSLRSAYIRSILTLSSGGLVISIAFISDTHLPSYRWLLQFAWCAFTLSIVVLVGMLLIEQRRLEHTWSWVRAELDLDHTTADQKKELVTWDLTVTNRTMKAGGGFFIAGAVLLLAFALANEWERRAPPCVQSSIEDTTSSEPSQAPENGPGVAPGSKPTKKSL
jgi:hypothetical protein